MASISLFHLEPETYDKNHKEDQKGECSDLILWCFNILELLMGHK